MFTKVSAQKTKNVNLKLYFRRSHKHPKPFDKRLGEGVQLLNDFNFCITIFRKYRVSHYFIEYSFYLFQKNLKTITNYVIIVIIISKDVIL